MIMLNHNMGYVYLKYSNLKRINAYSFTKMVCEAKTLLRFADWGM